MGGETNGAIVYVLECVQAVAVTCSLAKCECTQRAPKQWLQRRNGKPQHESVCSFECGRPERGSCGSIDIGLLVRDGFNASELQHLLHACNGMRFGLGRGRGCGFRRNGGKPETRGKLLKKLRAEN